MCLLLRSPRVQSFWNSGRKPPMPASTQAGKKRRSSSRNRNSASSAKPANSASPVDAGFASAVPLVPSGGSARTIRA